MSIEINKRTNPKKQANSFSIGRIDLFRQRRFRDKEKSRLYSDLHLLLSSGLDIHTVMSIQMDQSQREKERKIHEDVKQDIVSGMSMAEAFRTHNLAGVYEYNALKIGEESGKIEGVLKEIARYYERKIKQRRQVVGALTYPVLVLVTALLAVGFMLNVIVPMFEEVFERFQGNLPALTQRIIDISDWMKSNGWILLVILFCVILITRFLGKRIWFRSTWHRTLLKIPVFGKLIKDIESARFCHIMSLLTGAKSPLVQSLTMVADMIGFLPLKNAVSHSANEISSGKPFFRTLEESGFFDRKFSSLIKASEEVNRLDHAFNQLNDQYNQDIDHRLSVLSSLMEPLLIIFVGGLVAVILIAMYLPLFQIGTSIY